ncbi:MAG: YjfB family protein [Lachnospiraceae bacterium]|nr:YjfB family protein [Lachnospiraceae bacterium]
MNIASLSVGMAQNAMNSSVGTALLSKALDNNEIIGDRFVEMIDAAAMERSVNPHIGSNFDMLV